jgi:hypothetical protein
VRTGDDNEAASAWGVERESRDRYDPYGGAVKRTYSVTTSNKIPPSRTQCMGPAGPPRPAPGGDAASWKATLTASVRQRPFSRA